MLYPVKSCKVCDAVINILVYNHTTESFVYLEIRTYIGIDITEYPDSDKILIVPTLEIFNKNSQASYFDGEAKIKDKWKEIANKGK